MEKENEQDACTLTMRYIFFEECVQNALITGVWNGIRACLGKLAEIGMIPVALVPLLTEAMSNNPEDENYDFVNQEGIGRLYVVTDEIAKVTKVRGPWDDIIHDDEER